MIRALVLLLLAAPAAAQDAPSVADQRAALDRATARLETAIRRDTARNFVVSRRIHVDVSQSVFTRWLRAVAPNGLTAAARGTRMEGDVFNDRIRGLGDLSATPVAPETRMDLRLANPRIAAAPGRLTVTGNLSATASARARLSGAGLDRTADCRTVAPVTAPGTATFTLQPAAGPRVPYALRLTRPDNLVTRLDCDIADRRRIDPELPINSIAGNLSNGSIDIGLSTDLRLPTPGAGAPIIVRLAPRRPDLRITAQGLAYTAD